MLSPWEDTPHKNHKTLLGYVYVHETGQIFNWLKIQVFTRYSVHMEDLDAWWFKIFRVNRAQILKIFQPVQNITPCLVKVFSMKIWLLVTYTPKKHRLSGFSIEGGTRRLIAAYFGIYSRLLCVEVAFLCFVLTPLALLKSLLLYQWSPPT